MPSVNVEIVECHQDFVVIFKGAGIHSAPLQSGDTNCALMAVAEQFPEVLKVQGKKEVEGGLVHRIDQDTAGLLLLARNQDFYDHIIFCQDAGLFRKDYTAHCQYLPNCGELLGGFPPRPLEFPEDYFLVESDFRPYGPGRKQVRPVTQASGKFVLRKAKTKCVLPANGRQGELNLKNYSTSFHLVKSSIETAGKHKQLVEVSPLKVINSIMVRASITKGYRHQVRCHLAWCGLPIVDDPIYHPLCRKHSDSSMQFFATGLSFPLATSHQGKEIFSIDISSSH